jgi:nucleoside-diphosphate-sugar epimerase
VAEIAKDVPVGAVRRRSKALVAGISGTLGRSAAYELVKGGWEVHGVARSPGEFGDHRLLEAAVEDVEIQYGDLCDLSLAQKVCTDVSSVLFAAGASGVLASFTDPVGNLIGSALPWLNILSSCQRGTHLVFLSSQLVYGSAHDETPFTEQDQPRPESPYALHRALMEEYGRLFASRNAYDVTVLRLGNVFGEVIDVDYPRTHGVVARMLRDLVREGAAKLYGDGGQSLELLHAQDVGRAVAAVMASPASPGTFSIYNVRGERLTVREVADELAAGIGAGSTLHVPWEGTMQKAMAKDIRLCDEAFRARFSWSPSRNVREALYTIGACWRRAGADGVPLYE